MDAQAATIGFIGFGNMARAMADGLIKYANINPARLCACAAHFDTLERNCAVRGMKPMRVAGDVVAASDIVIVAVKPHQVHDVLSPVRDAVREKVVISVAVGKLFNFYDDILGAGSHHLSVIPNTPIAVGAGVIACETQHSLTEDQCAAFESIFSPIALIEWVESKLLSAASALAGSGPAFAAMFLESLGDAGVKCGLSRQAAYRLSAQMMRGTAQLFLETSERPASIKDAVCSPGGTTIKGVAALEQAAFRAAIMDAIDATFSAS